MDQYPKTFTHRNDHNSKVVVANADQEAQLPDEYLPAVTGIGGNALSAADHAADVMLSPEYSQLLADREALAVERADFAEHIAQENKALAAQRDKLEEDRKELVAGYTNAKNQLDADRARLEENQRQFDATKAAAPQTDAAGAPPADTTSAAPPPAKAKATAAPAKRVRHAKAD